MLNVCVLCAADPAYNPDEHAWTVYGLRMHMHLTHPLIISEEP